MQFKSYQQTNSLKTYSLFNFRIIYFILCSVWVPYMFVHEDMHATVYMWRSEDVRCSFLLSTLFKTVFLNFLLLHLFVCLCLYDVCTMCICVCTNVP